MFITTRCSYLAKEGEAALVRVEQVTKLRVQIHTLGGIVRFGRAGEPEPDGVVRGAGGV